MKILSKLVYAFTLIIFLKPCSAQTTITPADSARRLLDTVISFAKNKSLFRKKVDWQKVEDSVRSSAVHAVTIKEVLPSIQLLYKLLGDHHGFITYGGKYYGWRGNDQPIDPKTHAALLKKYKDGYGLTARMLGNSYGYLLIPDNNPTHHGDVDKIAQQIQDTLKKLEPQHLKGLIIDLRLNPGGDMYAMLGGLSSLFKPGRLGSFAFTATGQTEEWGIKNNKVYGGTDTVCHIKQTINPLYNLNVVVLIGPYTCSSGEATAISFKGRINTHFIGENTGGYTTSNESLQFTDQIGFFLATAVEADRNGKLYLDKVQPDEQVIGGDNFDDLKKDKKIRAALKWLQWK